MHRIEAINLTRGILCPHLLTVSDDRLRITRIQSTQCEQKLWDEVILSLGPELYMHVALGDQVTVHDVSERNRETRAMWQGLTLIRRSLETVHHLPLTPVTRRGGKAMELYFDREVIPGLKDSTRNYLRYWTPMDGILLQSCWPGEGESRERAE